jgi:hypothetical protein
LPLVQGKICGLAHEADRYLYNKSFAVPRHIQT